MQGNAHRTDCPIELRNNVKELAERMLELAEHLPPTIENKKGTNKKE